MNKEEILRKSREDNASGDERQKKIYCQSRILGMNVFYILAIILLILNQHFNRTVTVINVICDLIVVLFIVACVTNIYKFFHTKEKIFLLQAILAFIGIIIN